MIYNNVELFNVEQIIEKDGISGKILNRFSAHAIDGVETSDGSRGPVTSWYGSSIEIRFVAKSDTIDVYLGALDNDGYVRISNGDFDHSTVYLPKDEITCITLEKHPRLWEFNDLPEGRRFSKNVWRIMFLKRFTAVFAHVDGKGMEVRPPVESEVPSKTMLTYGSSISFGAGTGPMSAMTHLQLLARKLDIQVMNKSMPGSCFTEYSFGDYLSNVEADFYYYELGGNMRAKFSIEEFSKRAIHIVSETRRKHPRKPIILLTVYPLLKNLPGEDHEYIGSIVEGYDKCLAELARNDENIHLIDSSYILNDRRFMSFDGIHPSGYGNIFMAERLYDKIKHIIS